MTRPRPNRNPDQAQAQPQPVMPSPLYRHAEGFCQICNEPLSADKGEFALPPNKTDPDGFITIVADAQCGLNFNLQIA